LPGLKKEEGAMRKKTDITIAKRTRQQVQDIKKKIAEEFPDPVLRLEETKKLSGSKQPNLEEAYEGLQLIAPPFSPSVMTALPDLDPYLGGAIEAIAVNVGACDMEIKWTGDGNEKEREREILEAFFFESNDPTNPMSLQEKVGVCSVDYVELGSWNLEITEAGGKPVDLVHAPAEYMRVKSDQSGYKMVKGSKSVEFELYGKPDRDKSLNQILRAIRKRPGHRVYGKPIIYPLVNTVLINSLRDEKNLNWFDQGALADLLILLEENIEKGIKDQIVADYMNTGDGTETMYILDGVGKAVVEQIKRTLEDTSLEALEGNNRQRALTTLRVPPAKVGIYEDANRANTLTQDETFRNEVTKPIQDTFRVRFNHIIKHAFEFENWEFAFKPLSLRDRKEEAEIHQIYGEMGAENVNEIREAALNKEPVEGGDRRVINTPLGLVDLGTWEIAVADAMNTPEVQERLAKYETHQLIMRLVELRRELMKYRKGA
jgi:hypothetical protein